MRNLGNYIRAVRLQKGIGLNALAAKLDVSPAYLSNLENGKTATVSLEFLEKINDELQINLFFMIEHQKNSKPNSEFGFRLNRSIPLLLDLQKKHPQSAEFVLRNLEFGLEYFYSIDLSKYVN